MRKLKRYARREELPEAIFASAMTGLVVWIGLTLAGG